MVPGPSPRQEVLGANRGIPHNLLSLMLAICLALGASVGWGVSDFIAGTQSRILPVLSVIAVAQAIGFLWCACVLLVVDRPIPDHSEIGLAVVSGVALLFTLACFYKAMALGKISIVVPLTSMGTSIPVLVGIATGDRPGELQLVGMLVALAGVVLTAGESDIGEPERTKLRPGVLLAGAAAIGSGTFLLASDAASDGDPIWASFFNRTALLLILLVVVGITRPPLRDTRPHLPALAAVGTLDVSAHIFFGTASTMGLLSLVSVAASLYPAVTVLLAILLLRESVGRMQQAGIAAVLSGVALIAVG